MKDMRIPRMIPVFACCAMQSSYAMIMLSYKTRAMGFMGVVEDSPAKKLLEQLGDGLQLVLDALKNYSMAYEALGGQRGMSFPFLSFLFLSSQDAYQTTK
jgi:hypothetical protein